MTAQLKCFFCKTVYSGGKIFFRDTCPVCNSDLHICQNCQFFDPHAHQQCRESVSESIGNKERANFCEHFQASGYQQQAGGQDNTGALQHLEALFKK